MLRCFVAATQRVGSIALSGSGRRLPGGISGHAMHQCCHRRSLVSTRHDTMVCCVTCGSNEHVPDGGSVCDQCYSARRRILERNREEFVFYDECDWCSQPSEFNGWGMVLCGRCCANMTLKIAGSAPGGARGPRGTGANRCVLIWQGIWYELMCC